MTPHRAWLVACLLPVAVARADAPGAVTLNVPLSVRQMGMGGVSLGGTDVLRAWSHSKIGVRRAGYHALRKLTLSAHYSQPSSWESVAYPGPPVVPA